jgi:hypothetical protein
MAWFCGSGFAPAAGQFSGSVSTAIADIAIAARPAARPRGWNNVGAPTAVTSGVRKGGSIIATGRGNTGANIPA